MARGELSAGLRHAATAPAGLSGTGPPDLKPRAPITGRLRIFCINAGLSFASFPLWPWPGHAMPSITPGIRTTMTHYLPLYFPEADRYYTDSRAQWFTRLLHRFPCPAAITRYSREAFEQEAWTIVGRKVNKHGFLQDLYDTASQSAPAVRSPPGWHRAVDAPSCGTDAREYVSAKICPVYQERSAEPGSQAQGPLRRRCQSGARRAWVNQDGN